MSGKQKVYIGNLDGQRNGLVVARSKKEAASIICFSLYSFNQFWWQHPNPPDVADFEAGVLYSRPINDFQGKYTKGYCKLPKRL